MRNGNKEHILVIRLSALGDVAMTIPVLLAVARTYPTLKITFLSKKHLGSIPERIPNAHFMSFQSEEAHKGIGGLWHLSRQIRRNSIHSIADLHAVLRTAILKLFLLGSGIPFGSLDKGRAEKRRLTSGKPEFFSPLEDTVKRYARVFDDLGYPVNVLSEDVLPREQLPASLAAMWHQEDDLRLGIAPFAAHKGKCYPPEAMEQVVSRLLTHKGLRIYLFGGGDQEVGILDGWERKYSRCISVAGKIPLAEELALISNLDLMVSMDSGNGHLAAMYGIPVITIWGVTHPYAGFRPFGQPEANSILVDREIYPLVPTSVYGNKVPEGYQDAIASILPEQIYERILEVLNIKSGIRPDSGTST